MDESAWLTSIADGLLEGFENGSKLLDRVHPGPISSELLTAFVVVVTPGGDYSMSSSVDSGRMIEVMEDLLAQAKKGQN